MTPDERDELWKLITKHIHEHDEPMTTFGRLRSFVASLTDEGTAERADLAATQQWEPRSYQLSDEPDATLPPFPEEGLMESNPHAAEARLAAVRALPARWEARADEVGSKHSYEFGLQCAYNRAAEELRAALGETS